MATTLNTPTYSQVTGTRTVSATSTTSGLDRMEFYVDGAQVAIDTTSPYSFSLNTTLLENGQHSLYASAIKGGTTDTSTVNLMNVYNYQNDRFLTTSALLIVAVMLWITAWKFAQFGWKLLPRRNHA